jgi:hypothetical protein
MSNFKDFYYRPEISFKVENSKIADNRKCPKTGLTYEQRRGLGEIYFEKSKGVHSISNFETMVFSNVLSRGIVVPTNLAEKRSLEEIVIPITNARFKMSDTFDKVRGSLYSAYKYDMTQQASNGDLKYKVQDIIQTHIMDSHTRRPKYYHELIDMLESLNPDITDIYVISGRMNIPGQISVPFLTVAAMVGDDYTFFFSDAPVKDANQMRLRNNNFCYLRARQGETSVHKRIRFSRIKSIIDSGATSRARLRQELMLGDHFIGFNTDNAHNNMAYYTYGVSDMEGLMGVA